MSVENNLLQQRRWQFSCLVCKFTSSWSLHFFIKNNIEIQGKEGTDSPSEERRILPSDPETSFFSSSVVVSCLLPPAARGPACSLTCVRHWFALRETNAVVVCKQERQTNESKQERKKERAERPTDRISLLSRTTTSLLESDSSSAAALSSSRRRQEVFDCGGKGTGRRMKKQETTNSVC